MRQSPITGKWRWAALAAILAVLALLIPGIRSGLEDFGVGLVTQSAGSGAVQPDSSSVPSAVTSHPGPDDAERLRQTGSSQPEADPQHVDVPSREKDGGVEDNAAGTGAPGNPGRASPEPLPQRSISGSIIDDAGVPLSGLEVVASPVITTGDRLIGEKLDSQADRAVSDTRGMFEFSELEIGEYTLNVAESETHHGGTLRARAGSDAADIHLQRKGEIKVVGTVLDDTGAPLAGAGVRALGSDSRVSTDEQGRYQIKLDLQKVGGRPVLDFSSHGFRTQRKRVPDEAAAGETAVRMDIEMESLGDLVTFVGSVHGKSGEPVAGAGVTLSSLSSSFSANVSTGRFGEFSIAAVEAKNRYRLVIDPRTGNYRRFTSDPLVIDQGSNAFDVQLEDGGQASLAGTLVDPAGKPLPYFMLWVRNTDQAGTSPVPVQTDAGGRFDPVALGAGPIQLESRSSPRLEASGIALSSGESLDVQVPLDWGDDWLLGRVIDAGGQPVAQARVSVYWSRLFGDGRSMSSRQTRSDSAGFFEFSNLGARQYQVTCSAPGFRTRQLDAALKSEGELVIQLERLANGGS